MSIKNKYQQIFVTGGTGFLGSYIINELIKNHYSVIALKRENANPFWLPTQVFEKVNWITGDILDKNLINTAVKNADAIIHAAALVSFHKNERNLMYKVNIQGTENVVNAANQNKIKRFIYISSVAAIGKKNEGTPVNENAPWVNLSSNTHYAISKHLAEQKVWQAFKNNLEGVILNPSTILGYGNWQKGSCAIFKNVYQQFAWYTKGVNGFVDVSDVARATVLFLENNYINERYIVSAENICFQDVFNQIAVNFNKRKPFKQATLLLSNLAWRIEYMKSFFTQNEPLLTSETARIALSKTYYENDKILKTLQNFTFLSIQNSINEACKKYNSG